MSHHHSIFDLVYQKLVIYKYSLIYIDAKNRLNKSGKIILVGLRTDGLSQIFNANYRLICAVNDKSYNLVDV